MLSSRQSQHSECTPWEGQRLWEAACERTQRGLGLQRRRWGHRRFLSGTGLYLGHLKEQQEPRAHSTRVPKAASGFNHSCIRGLSPSAQPRVLSRVSAPDSPSDVAD